MQQQIIELEKKAAFQDHMLQELNDVLVAQQKQIDALEMQLKVFTEKFAAGDLVKGQEHEEPPPHY